MSVKHLRREPRNIRGNPRAWWYEEEQGINIAIESRPDGQIQLIDIPWRYLRKALKRLDKHEG